MVLMPAVLLAVPITACAMGYKTGMEGVWMQEDGIPCYETVHTGGGAGELSVSGYAHGSYELLVTIV